MASRKSSPAQAVSPVPGRRLDRRYLDVALAAALINTSYGTMSYAFSVLVTDSAAGGSFGAGAVSLGFGLALLVSGVAALGAGAVSDLFGSRRLLAGGAVAGTVGLLLFASCGAPWQAVVVLPLVMGPAMAATFYEPVYVLMNQWFAATERPRAYGVLTMLSGVSITIFTPLTQYLVDELGWRTAVRVLAGILFVVGLAVPLLLSGPRGERPAGGALRGNIARELTAGLRHTSPAFWLFSASFFVATAAFSGFSFHLVAQLESRGFDQASVALAIGVTGIVSLPARLLLPALSARFPSAAVLAACLVLIGGSAWMASEATDWWQVWAFVFVFGLVFGAVYPLRALVISERFAGPYFGRIIGLSALTVAFGRAAGPVVTGSGGDEGYTNSFRAAAVVLLVSAGTCWWSMRRHARSRGRRDRLC